MGREFFRSDMIRALLTHNAEAILFDYRVLGESRSTVYFVPPELGAEVLKGPDSGSSGPLDMDEIKETARKERAYAKESYEQSIEKYEPLHKKLGDV